MLKLVVFLCFIACGIVAIYHLSLYVIVSVVIALCLFLYYESNANWLRVFVRGLIRPTQFETSFRLWLDFSLLSVMNTCEKLRPSSHRSRTNATSPYAVGSNLTLAKTSHGNNTSMYYSGLCGENLEYKRRSSFTADISTDSSYSSTRSHNRGQRILHQSLSRCSGDLSFSPKGSPWGHSVSPKLRSHGSGVKTSPTVAGPLLASTRFNINKNTRIFGDVCSPGFTSRVAQYASENSKTLTHQKQYSGPGQFPLVQLVNTSSRLPLLSTRRDQTSVRSPVTIKIAPPVSSDARFLSKSQILNAFSSDEQHSSKSVLDVLKEMSRKRIRVQVDECDDDDAVKRQRKGEGQVISDHGSDMPQVQGDVTTIGKRTREETPNQSEMSCQSHQRQKKRTCNNEITSSLSSSKKLLNHMRTSTKRKSTPDDRSRSGTPVLCIPPKQSRQTLGDADDVLKTTEAVSTASFIHTAVTSSTTATLSSCGAEDRSAEKSEAVKPSEFLPKFAAVLNKSTGPVLNSVAALEAKRAYDSRTRLRSMLAVIAGEDDFLKELPSANETVASTAVVTTSFSSLFPTVATVAASSGAREVTNNIETSVAFSSQIEPVVTNTSTQASGDRSSYLPDGVSLTVPNDVSPPVPSTSSANINFGLLGSVTSVPVTSLLNKRTPSLTLTASSPASAPVSSEQKTPSMTLPSSPNMIAPMEEKIDLFKNVATTSSSGISFISGKFQSSDSQSSSFLNAPDSLPKVSAGDSSQPASTSTPDLGACNGSVISPFPKEQTSNGSVSDRGSSSSDFTSSSTNTVIYHPKPVATEATKSLFAFGNTAVTSSVNTTSCAPAAVTSDSVTESVFKVGSGQISAGLFSSPAVSTSTSISTPAAVGLFGPAKSDASTTLSSGTLNFGIKPATTNSLFQLNTATSSSSIASSVGGFKFDFSKGVKDNACPTVGGLQPTVNPTTSSTALTTTTSTIAISTASSVTISAPASTSQSVSPFKFGATPVPVFNNTSISTAPTQSCKGFPGGLFGKSQTEINGVTQPSQQGPFTLGASLSQNQGFSGTYTFGTVSSPLSGIKSGGFAFGSGGNAPSQTTQSSGGNLPVSQPVFGSSENKTDQSQPGSVIFGTLKSSGGVFGSTHSSHPTGGLFGSSVAQSGGLFESNGSSSGQVQLTGIFGNGTNPSAQSLLPSSGVFGSTGSQMGQPSNGLYGSGENVSTPSSQPSSGLFVAGGNVKTLASGGVFGSSENQSVQSPQPGTGLFGSVGSPSPQMTQPSGGIFQTQSQTVGIFGGGSSLSTQPACGAFGGGTSTAPIFAFGSTSSGTSGQQPVTSTSTGPSGAATPFQFGTPNNNTAASAPQPVGGFNFGSSGVKSSAPVINFTAGSSGNTPFQFGTGAAPVFGSQTTGQGMFSIGSGSTAPRARVTRPRRRDRLN